MSEQFHQDVVQECADLEFIDQLPGGSVIGSRPGTNKNIVMEIPSIHIIDAEGNNKK